MSDPVVSCDEPQKHQKSEFLTDQEPPQQVRSKQLEEQRSKKILARQKMRNVAELRDDDDAYDLRRFRKKIRKGGYSGQTDRPELNRIFRKNGHHASEVALPVLSLRCDIYKLSLQKLVNRFGLFDVVVIDERVSKVLTLDFGSLIQEGMLFVWAEHNEVQLGYHLLKWAGFEVVDQIVWVQTDSNDQLSCRPSNLVQAASRVCMVGFKTKPGKYLEYRTKISNNLVFSEQG